MEPSYSPVPSFGLVTAPAGCLSTPHTLASWFHLASSSAFRISPDLLPTGLDAPLLGILCQPGSHQEGGGCTVVQTQNASKERAGEWEVLEDGGSGMLRGEGERLRDVDVGPTSEGRTLDCGQPGAQPSGRVLQPPAISGPQG